MMMIDNNGGGGDDDGDEQVVLGRRNGGDGSIEVVEREHMFDKVVTPSDVGKLNRLVIPKQHAEKYFPLDSSTNEKGLLLNFEDRSGKQWRFRYSYWNSSQSYVMTKGWSRFVKEKKLDAGDIVSFQRGVGEFERDRLFIEWRRRPDGSLSSPPDQYHRRHLLPGSAAAGTDLSLPHHHQYLSGFQRSSNIIHPATATATAAWNPLFLQQQQLQQQQQLLVSSSSSSAAQYYPQPHYYRDHYNNTSHLLLPPADHSQNSTTTTSRHHPQSNIHPNNYMRSTNYNSATYHHQQVANPASAATTSCLGSIIYFRSAAAAAKHQQQQEPEEVGMVQVQRLGGSIGVEPTVVFESVPVVQGKAAAKRLRLFGVNMDCPVNISDSPNSADDINVECDGNNNNRTNTLYSSSATTITELGVSLAPHQYTSHNTCYNYNSLTATTILPSPYSTSSSSSSSSIPYLQLSPYPTTTAVNLPDMLNKGKSSLSFDLDI